MISSSLGRFVRATWPTSATAITSSTCAAATRAAVTTAPLSRDARTHQRRHSSSKTSRPSDGVKIVRSTLPSQQQDKQSPETVPQPGRASRRRPKASTPPRLDETFSNLPSVPPTSHLNRADVNLSSFFSLHRPISITSALPSPVEASSFENIFKPQANQESISQQWRLALQTFDSLSFRRRGEALQSTANGDGAVHLDGAPSQIEAFQQAVSMMAPYTLPPVPQPGSLGFDVPLENSDTPSPRQSNALGADLPPAQEKRRSFRQSIKRKSWSTTIIVTETTDLHGRKDYVARNSPIIQIPVPARMRNYPSSAVEEPSTDAEMEGPDAQQTVRWKQPFMQRMWLRQQETLQRQQDKESGMLLISVKRQRKLKMKKHKYKKLMRRTKNLRRRLGRD